MKPLTRCLVVFVACGLLAVTTFAGPEQLARDYKESKTVAVPPPPCNWQGFYVGLNAGGTWGDADAGLQDYNTPSGDWSYSVFGPVGGVEFGYNFQFGKFVVGVESDAGYLGLEGDGFRPTSPSHDTQSESKGGFDATLRLRLGVSLFHDKLLAYATGGGITVDNKLRVFDNRNQSPAGPGSGSGESDEVKFGWTGGGGLAYALACHWSVKVEYLFFSLEDEHYRFNYTSLVAPPG